MSGWAASLPATQRTWHQAQDRPLWESAEQSQALGIQRAQTGSGALCGTWTPRQSDLRLSHSNREGQCFPQETLCNFHGAWFSIPCRASRSSGLWTPLLSQGTPNTGSILPATSLKQGALDCKHRSSFGPSSGATSSFPSSSCCFCWSYFTSSFVP